MMTSTLAPLAVGQVAPDFTLRDQNGVEVSLAELTATKNVVVVFYPFAFSGICTGELDEIRDHLERFVSDDLQVVCISCDPMFSLRAWADAQGYFFPLLSDYWPHGEVTRAFGVLNEATGAPDPRHLPDRPRRHRALDARQRARGSGATSASCRPRSPRCVDRHVTARHTCHNVRGRPTSSRGVGRLGACSSAGRAPRLHREGRRFDPGRAHMSDVDDLTLGEVLEVVERLYPPATAQSWDRVGLVTGDPRQPVRRVHLAVDPTLAVIEEARELGADLLLTHHPLLLRGVHSVATTSAKGAGVTHLVVGDIALYVAHTNADVAADGVCEALAQACGLDRHRAAHRRRGPAAGPGRRPRRAAGPAHLRRAAGDPAARGRGRHPRRRPAGCRGAARRRARRGR